MLLSQATSLDNVQIYADTKSRGAVVFEHCDKTPIIQVKRGSWRLSAARL